MCFLANHNKMSVLWFALGIYIVGIAVVLFIRPTDMFSASGWKEFGLANTSNYTVFPFWMFAIVWAVVSYTVASLYKTKSVPSVPIISTPHLGCATLETEGKRRRRANYNHTQRVWL